MSTGQGELLELARWLDELAAIEPGDLPTTALRGAHQAQLRAAASAARTLLELPASGGQVLDWLQADDRAIAGEPGQRRAERADLALATQADRAQAIAVLIGALRPALRRLVEFARLVDGPC